MRPGPTNRSGVFVVCCAVHVKIWENHAETHGFPGVSSGCRVVVFGPFRPSRRCRDPIANPVHGLRQGLFLSSRAKEAAEQIAVPLHGIEGLNSYYIIVIVEAVVAAHKITEGTETLLKRNLIQLFPC